MSEQKLADLGKTIGVQYQRQQDRQAMADAIRHGFGGGLPPYSGMPWQ